MKKSKILAALLAAQTITGCSNIMTPTDITGIELPNIKFGDLTKFDQARFTDELKIKLSALQNQCLLLKTAKTDEADELRAKLGGDKTDPTIAKQLSFANAVSNIENEMANAYGRNNVSVQISVIANHMKGLTATISAAEETPTKGEILNAKLEAYQILTYMEQRVHYLSPDDKANRTEEAWVAVAKVNQLDANAFLPTSSLDAALRTLKLQLSIQRNEVTDFLQQFEDNAQSRAWLEEAADLGFDINLPRTRPQNREESGISL